MLPKWAWSGSREQFVHCGLRKFCHSKSSVYRWYTQLDRRRFVYDTWDNGSRLGRVMVECTLSITHCLRLNLQLHTIDLVRTCRISSFCTVAWQGLARFQLTRHISRSLGDSWASCTFLVPVHPGSPRQGPLNDCVCVFTHVANNVINLVWLLKCKIFGFHRLWLLFHFSMLFRICIDADRWCYLLYSFVRILVLAWTAFRSSHSPNHSNCSNGLSLTSCSEMPIEW